MRKIERRNEKGRKQKYRKNMCDRDKLERNGGVFYMFIYTYIYRNRTVLE